MIIRSILPCWSDAQTADLLCALLRPGNQGDAAYSVAVLKRIVRQIRQVLGSKVAIEIQADCGFATSKLCQFCEREGLQYVIGFALNPRLEPAVEPLLEKSLKQFEKREERQRESIEFLYQADSWDRSRRIKVEVNSIGINRCLVVTNYQHLSPEKLYNHNTDRGQTENFIKALEKDLTMDRLSWHRFLADHRSACCCTHWPIRFFYACAIIWWALPGRIWRSKLCVVD